MLLAWNSYPHFLDENNLSLVFTLHVHGYRFVFPGDMEDQGWRHLLANSPLFRQRVPGVHVLVASHHGRYSGIHRELFDVHGCSPAVVVNQR